MRLLETHPDQFDQAQSYEKLSDEAGKTFTWVQRMPLSELRKPENIAAIKHRNVESEVRERSIGSLRSGVEEEEFGVLLSV